MHRYPDRVLLKLVHVCAGLLPLLLPPRDGRARAGRRSRRQRSTRRSPISRAHPEIWEVILTGGDPLVLSPRRLARGHAAARRDRARQGHPLPHPRAGRRAGARSTPALVARAEGDRQGDLRRAARQPSARADAGGARRLRAPRRCRHPDGQPDRCCCAASTTMPQTLAALMRAFVECRIKPYYLHHGDLAPGTAHFRTDDRARARR